MKTVLITAGPTREYFDAVRFLTNGSTGAMGIEVARAAAAAGLEVHLALGPTTLPAPEGVELHRFVSAVELDELTREQWPSVDAFVAAAAVSDYRPAVRIAEKRKKTPGDWTPRLVRNPDILANRSREKGTRRLVGFALETGDGREEATRKLMEKRLDVIILNGPANMGAGRGDFEWIEASGKTIAKPNITKAELAQDIVEYLLDPDRR